MTQSFFEESLEQSQIKSRIVEKYFWAWAKILLPSVKTHSGKIGYIDLFAGPGRYKDGTKSTPLLILESAIKDPEIRNRLVTIFNDGDPENSQSLSRAIEELPGIDSMKYKPSIHNDIVGDELAEIFEEVRLIPSLVFIDPWGYKGLSLRLINAVIKDWGCECALFFNYNRINMGLSNPFVEEHMKALFGEHRARKLRQQLEGLPPEEREITVVEELSQALMEMGGRYILPFCFKNAGGSRTSHHLVFVTKHPLGYEVMKEIMAKECKEEQGVPTFEYNPATERQPLLFALTRPLDDLGDLLLDEFAGQTLPMVEVYERHHIGRRYIRSNYKEVLGQLEAEGRITVDPPADKRRKRNGKPTFANEVVVRFPAYERS